jgi:hypothetical protein
MPIDCLRINVKPDESLEPLIFPVQAEQLSFAIFQPCTYVAVATTTGEFRPEEISIHLPTISGSLNTGFGDKNHD